LDFLLWGEPGQVSAGSGGAGWRYRYGAQVRGWECGYGVLVDGFEEFDLMP
jgi:hypothetical protein